MHIVCVTRSAAPRRGGIEAHLDRVARGLAERGHSVDVYAARIDDAPFTRLNTTLGAQRFRAFGDARVTTRPLPLDAARRAIMLPALIGAAPGADRLGYDRVREATQPLVTRALRPGLAHAFGGAAVVHAWGGEPINVAAQAAAAERGKPFVVTPFAHPGHWGDDPLNVGLYRRADAVVALLPAEAAFYERLGVTKTPVIPVAAPMPATPKPPRIDASGPLVLCLGVKRRYKYKALLDAVPRIRAKDVRFAFVGPETPESDQDFARADDPRIVRRGNVDEQEKWGWLDAANVLCLPSVSEILPVSVLEAWRMGTAVVVAEGRFTRDLVADGVDGIVCRGDVESVARAVEEAIADPERLRAMGSAGAAKVAERYEPATVVAQHETLYASLA